MKQKILFVLSLLFGLMFINAGLDKFFNYMPKDMANMSKELQDVFQAFMTITWLMPLVGVVELLAGILFIIPRTRALGAIMIFPVMVGILLTNTVTDMTGFPIALVLLLINLWVIYEEKEKYIAMID